MPSLDQLHALLQNDPDDPFLLYALAQEHAKAGSHPEAIRWYDRCLEADPHYAYAYFHKARSQQAAGDLAAAVETLRRGLASARASGDTHASAELSGYLDEIEP